MPSPSGNVDRTEEENKKSVSQKTETPYHKYTHTPPLTIAIKPEPLKNIVGEGLTVPYTTDTSVVRPSDTARPPFLPEMTQSLPRRSASTASSLSGLPDSVSAMAGLPMAENSYDEIAIIGTGAYGTVYKGREKNNPEEKLVALKKLRMMLSDDGVPVNALREIAILKQLEKYNHPNIVKLLDICHGRVEKSSRLSLILVFEYIEQDLEYFMKKCPYPGIEPSMIQSLMHQIVCGVDFLHWHRIVHRDLKPQNILVSRHNVVKIADFGLAKVYDFYSKLTTMVVTLWYRSPEVLLSNSYATPVDMWACGCIFAELFKRKPLFEGQNEGEQLQRIFNVIGKPTMQEWPHDVSLLPSNFRDHPPVAIEDVVPELSSDASDLLKRMLTFVPENRISARDALTHNFFTGMTAPKVLPLKNSMSQVLCTNAAFDRSGLPSRGNNTPLSLQAQEIMRRVRREPEVNTSSVDSKNPSNDENNPNAGNGASESSHQMTKSPPSRGSGQSPTSIG